MRICCLSDLHGHLPEVPDCDLLVLAGDYAPAWRHHPLRFHADQLIPWVFGQKCEVVAVSGNHDLLYESHPQYATGVRWKYLFDSGCEINGLRIWGSPWQPTFGKGWAFNLNEQELAKKWELIPDDTDILILHGPPHGYGDLHGKEHTGSPSLTQRILEIQPKLVVAGHIHEGYGQYEIGQSIFVNASHVDLNYQPKNPPIIVEI